ncbi:MAG: MATE family efflux transporter [Bianqueaceae bacterium]
MDTQMTQPKENKMGVMPINKLLISMSLPMIISMLVQALYNIVDSMFVSSSVKTRSRPSPWPFRTESRSLWPLEPALASMLCCPKSLGEKNRSVANKTACNGVFLAFFSFLVFAVAGLFFAHTFFTLQTDIPDIVSDGTSYLTICCVFSFGVFFQVTFERLLQSTGKTFYTMITQGTGAIINIILDPILIFGLLGFPRMGVAGAAIATVAGQIVAALLALYFNLTKNEELHFSRETFRLEGHIIKRIYAVGVPSIIMASIGSVMTFGMNKILIGFTSTATAVFGVYFKLQSFIFMPIFGLNNGMVPIIAYNYGARKKERIMKTLRLSITYQHDGHWSPDLWLFPVQLLHLQRLGNLVRSIPLCEPSA